MPGAEGKRERKREKERERERTMHCKFVFR